MNKCLFLDRDGTINEFNSGFNHKKEDIRLIPGIGKLLKEFKARGYKLIVITNQGGIGMGVYTEEDLYAVNRLINELLTEYEVQIDEFYFCPHHAELGKGEYKIECSCRKPGNLLLEQAIEKFDIDRRASLFLGDNITDKLCADKSKIAFYPFEFRNVKTTSQGFRIEIKEYSSKLINDILSFAENLN